MFILVSQFSVVFQFPCPYFTIFSIINVGTGSRKQVEAPQFTAGRPEAALLFWFFGDSRCDALLFMVIHVIYKYRNR